MNLMDISKIRIMEKEENIKKTWETPEIVDLDLDKTGGGIFLGDEHTTASYPSAS